MHGLMDLPVAWAIFAGAVVAFAALALTLDGSGGRHRRRAQRLAGIAGPAAGPVDAAIRSIRRRQDRDEATSNSGASDDSARSLQGRALEVQRKSAPASRTDRMQVPRQSFVAGDGRLKHRLGEVEAGPPGGPRAHAAVPGLRYRGGEGTGMGTGDASAEDRVARRRGSA